MLYTIVRGAAVLLTSAMRCLVSSSSFCEKESMKWYEGIDLILIVRSTSQAYLREEVGNQGAT